MNLAIYQANAVLRKRMEAEGIELDESILKAAEWRFRSVLRHKGRLKLMEYARTCQWWQGCKKAG